MLSDLTVGGGSGGSSVIGGTGGSSGPGIDDVDDKGGAVVGGCACDTGAQGGPSSPLIAGALLAFGSWMLRRRRRSRSAS